VRLRKQKRFAGVTSAKQNFIFLAKIVPFFAQTAKIAKI
jgi:hypothetical protein